MKVCLEITDQITGKDHLMQISVHDAQRLYQALREIVGDAQYQAQPGQLVTMPDMSIKL